MDPVPAPVLSKALTLADRKSRVVRAPKMGICRVGKEPRDHVSESPGSISFPASREAFAGGSKQGKAASGARDGPCQAVWGRD